MRLSDNEIKYYLRKKELVIEPYKSENVQPASVDLTLGTTFYIPNSRAAKKYVNAVEPAIQNYVDYWVLDEVIVHPGQFIIASTVETVTLPANIQGQVDGKSKLARTGLTIHQTGGFIDPGFNGQITLEITNVAPWNIRLTVNMEICQISFSELTTPARHPYGSDRLNSHYQGQQGATLPSY